MKRVVSSYTRANAMADGVLVDISKLAAEAGFRYPVAVTCELWDGCVAVEPDDVGQYEEGRLWDILQVLRYRIRSFGGKQTVGFEVLISKGGERPRPVALKAHCGAGDNLEPVITVMMQHED